MKRIDRRKLNILRSETIGALADAGNATICIMRHSETDRVYVERIVDRNKVRNIIDKYEFVREDGSVELTPLTEEIANQIVERVLIGDQSYNACLIFFENEEKEVVGLEWEKTEQEHMYTSTGIKFWRHQDHLRAYKDVPMGSPRSSVISTHISPEGKCNLKCPYCSVTYRDTHSRIALPRIKKYVIDLAQRGLKAVILTGGGEPTLYPQFNELVQWLKHDMNLSVALITNGTMSRRIEPETLRCFSWVRVSINVFPGWENLIKLDLENLGPECVVGCSMVYTVEHEASDEILQDRLELFSRVSKVADNCGAQYIRLLPNCLLEQKQLIVEHHSLQKLVSQLGDSRYFQQYKIHGAPEAGVCHQAYFRPYLSEEPWHEDGEPGTVYPCDSVVLNESLSHFAKRYQVCKPEDVLDFVDGKLGMQFQPNEHCKGCVFTDNVNMLKRWKEDGVDRFDEFPLPLVHEEFV